MEKKQVKSKEKLPHVSIEELGTKYKYVLITRKWLHVWQNLNEYADEMQKAKYERLKNGALKVTFQKYIFKNGKWMNIKSDNHTFNCKTEAEEIKHMKELNTNLRMIAADGWDKYSTHVTVSAPKIR